MSGYRRGTVTSSIIPLVCNKSLVVDGSSYLKTGGSYLGGPILNAMLRGCGRVGGVCASFGGTWNMLLVHGQQGISLGGSSNTPTTLFVKKTQLYSLGPFHGIQHCAGMFFW